MENKNYRDVTDCHITDYHYVHIFGRYIGIFLLVAICFGRFTNYFPATKMVINDQYRSQEQPETHVGPAYSPASGKSRYLPTAVAAACSFIRCFTTSLFFLS